MADAALIVPIFVDGLHLPVGRPVTGPLYDFENLPWASPDGDQNSSTPWIGTEAAREPVEGLDGWLGAGVHLHWALPDAFTHARREGDSAYGFRPVPDRWLVRRRGGGLAERAWLVESNYLWPVEQVWPADNGQVPEDLISYLPTEADHARIEAAGGPGARSAGPAWRYVGRRLNLHDGQRPGDDPANAARYLQALTALGYGEGHFAAYYPSCRSVFGLHDPEVVERVPPGLVYEVFGWFSQAGQDPLQSMPAGADPAAWLAEELGWRCEASAVPGRLLCAARLLGTALDGPMEMDARGLKVAVADTAIESFAALVADKVDGHNKAHVEEFLEAMMVADDLGADAFDFGPRTEAALHARRFRSTMADPIWAVRPIVAGTASEGSDLVGGNLVLPGPEALATGVALSLPDEVALALNLLNDAQRALNEAGHRLQAARRHLHLAWCRSQIARYPPPDAIPTYSDAVAAHDADVVRSWLEDVHLGAVAEGEAEVARATSERDLAHQALDALVRAHNEADRATTDEADPARSRRNEWELVPVEGPRFYVPVPPTLTVMGLRAAASDRHHNDGAGSDDGLLLGHVVEGVFDVSSVPNTPPALSDVLAGFDDGVDAAGHRSDARPHPLFLEWMATIAPLVAGNTVDPTLGRLDPDLVRRHFAFREHDAEFQITSDPVQGQVAPVRGRGFLAWGVQDLMTSRLQSWLERRLRTDAGTAKAMEDTRTLWLINHGAQTRALTDQEEREATLAELEAAVAYVKAQGAFAGDAAVQVALPAWDLLHDEPVLSQDLAGFHESLCMLRPAARLPVDDPLAFEAERAFARDVVRAAVGAENDYVPDVSSAYTPVRSGTLRLQKVQLIDIWGRPTELPLDEVVTTERLRVVDGHMALSPRLGQSARLSLRWLDAVHDEQEMNTHPASSPICGWIVPDTLEGRIHVYDADGVAMGSVDPEGGWRIAPGGAGGAVRPADLPNPHLVKVADWLVRQDPDEIAALVETLETALEFIAPPTSRQQECRAVLMGRPIAVVRARINLELQHPMAQDQSMKTFSRELSAYRQRHVGEIVDALGGEMEQDLSPPDPTHGLEHVSFPIRIGEQRRFNDGVVGYFVEDPEEGGFLGDVLWAPQGGIDHGPDDSIDVFTDEDGAFNVWHTLADPPVLTTVLFDPRGTLHATCGILPAKSVEIPRIQYERAMNAIAVSFLTAPVLTPADQLEIPLPELSGWSWSWLAVERGRWQRLAKDVTITRAELDASFAELPTLWEALHLAGWLQPWPGHGGHARVVPATQRPELPAALQPWLAPLQRVLDTAGRSILPPAVDARFGARVVLREGWLQLTRDPGDP
jgi:hypothetical protein